MSENLVTIAPELKTQYEAAADAVLEKTIGLLDDPSWKESKKEPTITFYTRSEAGSSFSMVKSQSSIPVSIDKVIEQLDMLDDITPDMDAKKRDGVVRRTAHLLDASDPHRQGILYLALESGSRFVTNRDFLMYRKYYEKEGKHFFVHVSVEHPELHQPTKEFVRARILLQVFIADQDPDNANATRLRFVVHADPAGSVPAMVYNMTAVNQGYSVKKIYDELVK